MCSWLSVSVFCEEKGECFNRSIWCMWFYRLLIIGCSRFAASKHLWQRKNRICVINRSKLNQTPVIKFDLRDSLAQNLWRVFILFTCCTIFVQNKYISKYVFVQNKDLYSSLYRLFLLNASLYYTLRRLSKLCTPVRTVSPSAAFGFASTSPLFYSQHTPWCEVQYLTNQRAWLWRSSPRRPAPPLLQPITELLVFCLVMLLWLPKCSKCCVHS